MGMFVSLLALGALEKWTLFLILLILSGIPHNRIAFSCRGQRQNLGCGKSWQNKDGDPTAMHLSLSWPVIARGGWSPFSESRHKHSDYRNPSLVRTNKSNFCHSANCFLCHYLFGEILEVLSRRITNARKVLNFGNHPWSNW